MQEDTHFRKMLIKFISALFLGAAVIWIILGFYWQQGEAPRDFWGYHLQGLLGIFLFWGIGAGLSHWLARHFQEHQDLLLSSISQSLDSLTNSSFQINKDYSPVELKMVQDSLLRFQEHFQSLLQLNEDFTSQLESHVHEKTQEYLEVCEELINMDSLKTRFMLKSCQTLRTPISIIRTYSEILENIDLKEENKIREMAAVVHNESLVLSDMVSELFELLTLKERGLEMDREMVDIRSLLKIVESETRSKFTEKEISYVPTIQGENLMVIADRQRLERSLKRLLEVALIRTEEGQVRLIVEENNEWMIIRIIDDAPPVKAEELELDLHELVKQADDYYTNNWSGLKLALCNELISLQGGELKIEVNADQKNEMQLLLIPYQSESLQLEPELY
ncbi:MAG: HAMP domain-containing histidine kinase [SAR324 cluster bacterium]|nr:HAMP domain-containing histidine kinase [SAR324 cluster bacterium]